LAAIGAYRRVLVLVRPFHGNVAVVAWRMTLASVQVHWDAQGKVARRGCQQTMPPMNNVTIYHNPACGTSRNTLALIRHAGIEPTVVEYLKTPPSKEQLRELVAATGQSVRALLREKGTPYAELGLDDPKWSDEQLLDFIVQHPILMNRPLVVTPLGTALCRPSEKVLELLPVPTLPPMAKEDGEVVRDTGVRRSSGQ
jgi:arsenate reductase